MNQDFFNNLLKYHKKLVDPEFLRAVMTNINQRNKQRSIIMMVFSVIGSFASIITLVSLKSTLTFSQSTTGITLISITFISLFIIWLIFEETEGTG